MPVSKSPFDHLPGLPSLPMVRHLNTPKFVWLTSAISIGLLFILLWRTQVSGQVDASSLPVPLVALSGPTMGSSYHVMYVPAAADNAHALARVKAAVEEVLEQIEQQFSTWRDDSQLARFNRAEADQWIEVAQSTIELVELAARLNQLSNGKFDVTIGPLIELWGFGRGGRAIRIPDDAAITAALNHTGMQRLRWRSQPPALYKLDGGLQLDLSALVAGHAADRLSRRLLEMGIADHYVEVTGEIVAVGRHPTGRPWIVGIAPPELASGPSLARVNLVDAALATSGNYRNFQRLDGRRFGHLLDGTTGQPVQSDVLSASVIADNCALADGLATLFMLLPGEQALQLADQQAWQVLLVVQSAEGTRLRQSTSWANTRTGTQ